MKVSILYRDDCPNWREVDERVRESLRALGRTGVEIEHVEVTTLDEAEAVGLRGSPTVLVDGHDPFDANAPVQLSCRTYRTGSGMSGLPSVEQLVKVLR
jgi:hypothetical protein